MAFTVSLVTDGLFSSAARNKPEIQGQSLKKRSKDILKRRSAEGQSSCVPPGKNHMPWEKESRENTAAVGGCVCVCARIHMHTLCICTCRCVHFVQRRTTEEDGGHVWVFGKTLMSTIWTTAENREEQAALCSTDDFSYIRLLRFCAPR